MTFGHDKKLAPSEIGGQGQGAFMKPGWVNQAQMAQYMEGQNQSRVSQGQQTGKMVDFYQGLHLVNHAVNQEGTFQNQLVQQYSQHVPGASSGQQEPEIADRGARLPLAIENKPQMNGVTPPQRAQAHNLDWLRSNLDNEEAVL